jgi:hypothetical protein
MSEQERCPACDDCPDLVAYGFCDVCGNRAEKAGLARHYQAEPPYGYREPDGLFTPVPPYEPWPWPEFEKP